MSKLFDRKACTVWRDVDGEGRQFGFGLWLTGGEVRIGRRLYRARWAWRS